MAKAKQKTTTGSQASLKDVARLAGVSMMTVSRALHCPDKVSDETRKRVEEIARRLFYVPSQAGRSLSKKRKAQLIGIIIPSIRNPIFADILQGVLDVVRRNGFHVLIGDSSGQEEEEIELTMAFLAHRPDGLILHSTTQNDELRRVLSGSGLPVVETSGLEGDPIDMLVGYSNFDASAAAVRYLVERGYRKIGLITSSTTFNRRAVTRRDGYLRIIREAGLPELPRLMVEARASYDDDWSGEALCRLLKRDPTVDAVFCAGYASQAVGSVFECQRRGWPVPGRLAIVGFDDIPIVSKMTPPLTTVRIPRYEMGRTAATLLLDRIAGRPLKHTTVDVGFSLIERGSA